LKFGALFLKPDAGRYLAQLRSVADGILERTEAWIGHFPAFDATPTPARAVNAKTLRAVIAAIRRAEAIEVQYQSLSHPEPKWRWIAPHAIGFDGFRWHARAFCEVDGSFKDFLMSRIMDTRTTRLSESNPETDTDWQNHVVLEIGPHPDLSETQKKVIGLDYGMRNGKAEIRVRRAFLYYTLKRLGLDTDPAARKPQDQQVVLLNRTQVYPAGGLSNGLD
jgi:predicted DNA-binding transcriptional regulator YafY